MLRRDARVSVIVPVFNYGRFLRACLRSVLDQEHVDLDVVVLDDCSTDDSLEIASDIAAADPRVRVIAHARNRGHIPTVNEGVKAVDGEYVVKLDADDLLTPGSLARSVALLDAFPSVGFVYGLPLLFHQVEPPPARSDVRRWTAWPGHDWLTLMCQRGTNCIKQPEVVIRAAALRQAGAYREELPHTSDFEMWMRLAARHDVGRVDGPHQGCYREHPDRMSQTVHGGVLIDITERLRGFDGFFSRFSRELADADRLRAVAHQALAKEALGYAISAYARGVADEEPIDAYAALAEESWPPITDSRLWHTLARLRGMDSAQIRRRPSVMTREALRNLRFRLLWRRWVWSGV